MSKHVSYRGVTIDMDSLARENEKVPAIGNMPVNGRGDQIKGGQVTRTADQIARDNHRVQSIVVDAGLKGPMPALDTQEKTPHLNKIPQKATGPAKAKKEVELPSKDIIVGDDE